ncbi:MAG: PqqD family protein [Elusimicrobiales bacterium]|jgi:hypothetical protein
MKIKEKLASREIAGELYIVDIEAEILHALNPTAAFLWECLKKGLTAEKAALRLAAEFEVSPQDAQNDTELFIKTLKNKGLIS